ncbi:MAG: hypothetical protein DRQ55_07090 [Planctomycetota bacterium]|nr:MAG: hypothetical protein DRQ55_07090 [Planctomycetota bacterium]
MPSLLGLALLMAPGAGAQIADDDVYLATTTGIFRVADQSAGQRVLAPADLGLTRFVEPSLTWIPNSPYLLLTLRDSGAGGRVFRLDMSLATPRVDDWTARLGSPADPVDAAACLVTERLFVLDAAAGAILALDGPADPSGPAHGDVALWAQTAVLEPLSLAVNAAQTHYSLVVVGAQEIWRYSETEPPELLATPANGLFQQTAANPVTGEFYVLNELNHVFGKLSTGGLGTAVLNFNLGPLCNLPVRHPEDMVWDASRKRLVVVAGRGVECLFGGAAAGQSNSVVRMPFAIGPVQPKLLTAPLNAIDGSDADLALVRWDEPQIARRGSPGTTQQGTSFGWTSSGYLGQAELGEVLWMRAHGGPADAQAWLLLGSGLSSTATLGGTPLMPTCFQRHALLLDGEGAQTLQLSVPNDVALAGVVVWAQLWADDSEAPGSARWVPTQVAGYAIGD